MVGSDFPEHVKREARRLAAFKCCYCREMGDHVHHLLPKEEGGQGVIENAILLCVQCHDRYGHRPDKRAQLRQARDIWYEVAAAKYSAKDLDHLENLATKADLTEIKAEIRNIYQLVVSGIENGSIGRQTAANVASTMSSLTMTGLPVHLAMTSGVFEQPLPLRASIGKPDPPEST